MPAQRGSGRAYGSGMSPAAIEVFAEVGCDLGEGPLWWPERGVVVWVDLGAGRIWECPLDGEARVLLEHPEPVGALALARTGELIGFTPSGLWRLDGVPTLLVPTPEPDPRLRANDGKPDPAGRFVGGTMSAGAVVEPVGTLWSFAGGTARPLRRGTRISNGVAWTADGATMYWTDSGTGTITAFAYDLASGTLHGERPFVRFADGQEPDGITIDAEGAVWVAMWGGGCLHRYAPDGELVEVVVVPVPHPTCPVFAGPDLDVLVVTTARGGSDHPAPGAGDVYALRPAVRGAAAPRADLAVLLG